MNGKTKNSNKNETETVTAVAAEYIQIILVFILIIEIYVGHACNSLPNKQASKANLKWDSAVYCNLEEQYLQNLPLW